RIGENIIVFDFIRPDVAEQIFQQMIDGVIEDLQTQGVILSFTPDALESLKKIALADLSNGGRGIRNQIEAHLLNPLARELFKLNPQAGQALEVTATSGKINLGVNSVKSWYIARSFSGNNTRAG
ncbi:ClpB protein, partial [Gilliamella apicola SCGC AB-598-B02]